MEQDKLLKHDIYEIESKIIKLKKKSKELRDKINCEKDKIDLLRLKHNAYLIQCEINYLKKQRKTKTIELDNYYDYKRKIRKLEKKNK